MTQFFIPDIEPERAEEVYAAFAAGIHKPVPAVHERIETIAFRHDGVNWTAQVGHQLHGERIQNRRRQGKSVEVRTPVYDDAMVLAIFSGDPYIVFTNAGPGGSRSDWINPFMAGRPSTATRFAQP